MIFMDLEVETVPTGSDLALPANPRADAMAAAAAAATAARLRDMPDGLNPALATGGLDGEILARRSSALRAASNGPHVPARWQAAAGARLQDSIQGDLGAADALLATLLLEEQRRLQRVMLRKCLHMQAMLQLHRQAPQRGMPAPGPRQGKQCGWRADQTQAMAAEAQSLQQAWLTGPAGTGSDSLDSDMPSGEQPACVHGLAQLSGFANSGTAGGSSSSTELGGASTETAAQAADAWPGTASGLAAAAEAATGAGDPGQGPALRAGAGRAAGVPHKWRQPGQRYSDADLELMRVEDPAKYRRVLSNRKSLEAHLAKRRRLEEAVQQQNQDDEH